MAEQRIVIPPGMIFPDEDLHDINRRGLYLLQKKNGYRYTMDAVLLAEFANLQPDAHVADFGSGSGVISLLLHARGKGGQYYSFERQPSYADMADRSVRLNRLVGVIHTFPLQVELANRIIGQNSLDAIVSNPPFYLENCYLPSRNEERMISRTMPSAGLDTWLKIAYQLLRGKGKIFLVYPAERLPEMMGMMMQRRLAPKRLRMVHPRAGVPANLVLLEGMKDGKPLLQIEPPLIVRHDDGSFTEDIHRIYGFRVSRQ